MAGIVIGAGGAGAVWALTDSGGPSPEAVSPPPSPATQTPSPSPTPTVFQLTGTFLLTRNVVSDGEGGCEGSEGFDDIAEGAAVTVYDAAGTVIATGALGESTRAGTACSFEVIVPDVPAGEGFHKVEITHRGTLQISEPEAMSGSFGGSLG
ncbi:hypothetical protein [Streptomyces sp. NRRL F-5727]|uniref:hypothetical protein n=1 Tax=Streptomyces sp. NRRL F-5727 TaxID=1463871 RepID=UPI001F1C5785|nr:hypothetical protein [Streptomyces sp. NRRL F-5727]